MNGIMTNLLECQSISQSAVQWHLSLDKNREEKREINKVYLLNPKEVKNGNQSSNGRHNSLGRHSQSPSLRGGGSMYVCVCTYVRGKDKKTAVLEW